jgi:hypothetical protein
MAETRDMGPAEKDRPQHRPETLSSLGQSAAREHLLTKEQVIKGWTLNVQRPDLPRNEGASAMIYEGYVTKVETSKSTLTVKSPATVPTEPAVPGQASPTQPGQAPQPSAPFGKEITLSLKKEVPITLDGKKVALSELKPGQKVKVNYEATTPLPSRLGKREIASRP